MKTYIIMHQIGYDNATRACIGVFRNRLNAENYVKSQSTDQEDYRIIELTVQDMENSNIPIDFDEWYNDKNIRKYATNNPYILQKEAWDAAIKSIEDDSPDPEMFYKEGYTDALRHIIDHTIELSNDFGEE